MKRGKLKFVLAIVVVLSLLIFVEFSQAATLRPWVRFRGTYQVTAGIGTGSLTLNSTVWEMDYENGDVWRANVPGVETVFGARIVLSGATRTDNYSFNGDPANPNDVTFSIVALDGYVYFASILADSTFVPQGTNFVWLNQFLDPNNPATLDLHNVVLRPNGDDGLHPSRYISELAAYMGSTNVSGLRMQLFVPSTANFTTNSSGAISYGLVDGLQSLNTPPVADAGADITIPSNQVATTTVSGTVTDEDSAYTLTCRWTETDESGNVLSVLQDWTSVGINGECPLNLGALSPALGLGMHILNLEANDGEITSSDNMTLTINNSVPNANAGNDIAITSEQVAATTIQGVATDFDGNALTCSWMEGVNVLQVSPAGTGGACPLDLGTHPLGIGTHTLTLSASDGLATSSDDMVLTINNTPPVADAGENINITSEQTLTTTLQGTATDFDTGDSLTCRWMEGTTILQDWFAAAGGACPLNLGSVSLAWGTHTLTLTASDGQTSTSDNMILTIDNSAPHAAPGGAGIVQYEITLVGDVSDYDGDILHYQWLEGTNVFCEGYNIQSIPLGDPVMLPDCVVSNLSIGTHTISLEVFDLFNLPDKKDITVIIKDSTAPNIAPVASAYIMWPPNHIMVNIAINANATDNSGLPVTLTATVVSNELIDGLGDGDTGPDWTQPVIDQNTGMIYLQLRRERSGKGTGRVYTITITATDSSGFASTAKVNITVPHDMGKK